MYALTLGVRVPGVSGIRRHRLSEVDFRAKLSLLKQEASRESGIDVEAIELVHHGKVLDDEKSLVDCGVKPGEVVYVLKKNVPKLPEPIKKISELTVQEYVLFFKFFENSADVDLSLLLQIRDYGHSESFISSMPALANDPVAINYLREPDLLAHMSEPEVMKKIAEEHPAFMEAIQKIMELKDTKQSTSSCNPNHFHSPDSDDDEVVDIGRDHDDDDGNSEGQQGGMIITPEQLSTALALAGMSAGTNSSNSRSSSSTSDNALPGFREFLGSLLAADRPSSSPGPSRPIITPDMFSNALSQAITNVSTSSSTPESSTSTSDGGTAAEEAASARLYADQLAKMQEMGLTDSRINLRALIINNGDVNAAINLVLSYLT